MTIENFDTTIDALWNRRPYRPFTIVLLNGERYEIDFPGALTTRGGGVAIFLAPGNIPVFFDHEGVNQIIGDLASHGMK